jgi:hypothetical protein
MRRSEEILNPKYQMVATLIKTERRSSDRRSPKAERFFANADLKIGVPDSLYGRSIPSGSGHAVKP